MQIRQAASSDCAVVHVPSIFEQAHLRPYFTDRATSAHVQDATGQRRHNALQIERLLWPACDILRHHQQPADLHHGVWVCKMTAKHNTTNKHVGPHIRSSSRLNSADTRRKTRVPSTPREPELIPVMYSKSPWNLAQSHIVRPHLLQLKHSAWFFHMGHLCSQLIN